MRNSISSLILVATMTIIEQPGLAQEQHSNSSRLFGWDLSYSSVLKRNKVGRDEYLWKWLKQNGPSYTRNLIASWRGEPISSSILIEHPAFHAGEHQVLWLVRTESKAYYWRAVEGKSFFVKEEFSPQLYDRTFEAIASWTQAKPLSPKNTPPQGVPGYFAFLNLYNRDTSRQMLLTLEDFYIDDTTAVDNARGGRLMQLLEPVLEPRH